MACQAQKLSLITKPNSIGAICLLMAISLIGSAATAQVVPEMPTNSDQKAIELIEQLGSPNFSDRKTAQRQLLKMGLPAIKPLESAILTGDSDIADRALEILKLHFRGDALALADAAKESLQRIKRTEGHRKQAAAGKILSPPVLKPDSGTPIFPPRMNMPQIQFQGGGNRISVKSRSVNGMRDVSIDENGKKWRFSDLAGGAIKVQTPDGKGGTKTKQYPDKNAFEKADPDAYKMFQKYAGNGNGMQLQLGGGGFGGGGFGGGLFGPQFPFGPGFQPRQFQRPERQLKPINPPAQPREAKPKFPKNDQDLIEV